MIERNMPVKNVNIRKPELYFTKMGCKMRVACCVFVLAVSTTEILAQLNDTHYPVELNGEILHCKLCPPGTFWIEHCTQNRGSQCQDCPDGRFETDYNRAFYCERCTECTGNDQTTGEVAEACTRFHDTRCECKPGYWREESVGDCQEVSPCEPGYGVKKMANSHKDTTCERCVNGKTFSNISSEVMPCLNCSLCPEGWVQRTPCNETQDTVCISKDEEEKDSNIIILFGVACGVLLAVAIVSYYFRKRIQLILQQLLNSWIYFRSQENHDAEEQANPRQVNHDDEEKANPLLQDRRRQENHDDEEQTNPLQQDRRRQENHVDEEQATPLQHDRRHQENHDDEEQANPLQQDRRRQETHDYGEQANPLQQERRRQETHDYGEQANPLQQGGTPDKSAVNISRQQF
ncbi:tumor necrosis factor receptor superfamily member 5-like [Mya arenaria]|uniref:tumor necrosis factor receptor superfamily member 5-like n=1 Tax=Mya arenaria TaxID=6604 RepID=UPI0022E755A5|nr:tumor necrosis factor receptor superfamily member 5-like [Mya arenaria]